MVCCTGDGAVVLVYRGYLCGRGKFLLELPLYLLGIFVYTRMFITRNLYGRCICVPVQRGTSAVRYLHIWGSRPSEIPEVLVYLSYLCPCGACVYHLCVLWAPPNLCLYNTCVADVTVLLPIQPDTTRQLLTGRRQSSVIHRRLSCRHFV